MYKPPAGRAALAASSALAAVLLTSCGAPALTAGGSEVKVSEEVISSLETQWKDHLAAQPEAATDENSGCYVGSADGAVSGTAFCGPVHYLGQDSTGWDMIQLDVADEDGKAALASRGPFAAGPLDEGTQLIRHDGRDAERDAELPEPDALKTAEPLEVFTTGETLEPAAESTAVELPAGTLAVTGAGFRERAGGASDRTAAPEGFRMASVSFEAEDLDRTPTVGTAELSFIVDGEDYPFDDLREGGTASIAVPEDAGVSFGVTFDKVVQSVDIADMKLDAGEASALYAPQRMPVPLEEMTTDNARWQSVMAGPVAYLRSAPLEYGWAGKDKVWIRGTLDLSAPAGEPGLKKKDGMKVVSSVMTTADGTVLEAAGDAVAQYWESQQRWQVFTAYKAPQDVGEVIWNVTAEDNLGNVYISGPMTLGSEEP